MTWKTMGQVLLLLVALFVAGVVIPYLTIPDDFIVGIASSPWSRTATVGSYLIALSGFGLTIWGVIRSKTAAESAQAAAEDTHQKLVRSQAIADVSRVLTAMREIKRLHRAEQWQMLPDRYADLRELLITVRTQNPRIDQRYGEIVQTAVRQLGTMENEVESVLAGGEQLDPARLNQIVTKQTDRLAELLGEFMSEVEG